MEISDPTAIRALAHPLRLDLLELLAASGPATAAQCGRVLGVPQANCSFHLRQLAKYGFVEDAAPGRDRRARRWQVPDPQLRVRITGAAVVRHQLEQVVVEREAQAILEHTRREDAGSVEWQQKAGIMTALAVLSADEAAELRRQWQALLEPYIAAAAAGGPAPEPGRRYVRYFLAATPLPPVDLGDNDDETD
jgi:DNA-binding transcriptional ArsR family regulator